MAIATSHGKGRIMDAIVTLKVEAREFDLIRKCLETCADDMAEATRNTRLSAKDRKSARETCAAIRLMLMRIT